MSTAVKGDKEAVGKPSGDNSRMKMFLNHSSSV